MTLRPGVNERVVDDRLRIYEQGGGPLTVVIVTGAGDPAASWAHVADQLGTFVRVITFDRPGIGFSPSPRLPRTAAAYLAELDRVIDSATGSALLVGHSLGGLLATMFARANPSAVKGLLLVDATPPAIADDRSVQAAFAISGALAGLFKAFAPLGITRFLLNRDKMPLYPEQAAFRAVASADDYQRWIEAVERTFRDAAGPELRSVLPVAREASQHSTTGAPSSLPTGVLNSRAYGNKWLRWQEETANRAAIGFHHVTPTARHNIHLQHPDLVVDSVRELVGLVHQAAE